MTDPYTDPYTDGYEDEETAGAGAAVRPERTFAALPPAHGRGFARTWWGQAWLKALEDTALDGQQLKRGRRHAREGAVGAVSVQPGRITAVVRDRDGAAYRSDVLLQELGEGAWDQLLEMVADRSGHIAALLDRDMPPHLVEDAEAAGVELLPGIGDLEPECACEAWDHCPHTAALCYQVARLLDEDPFILLLMRGRGERELLEELQARSAVRGARRATRDTGDTHDAGGADGTTGASEDVGAAPEPVGVDAVAAFSARASLPPLPGPPPAVGAPVRPPTLDGGTEPGPGLDPAGLEFLIADTAARARRMLTEALAPDHATAPVAAGLTVWQDAVRMAATAGPEAPLTAPIGGRLADGCGRDRGDLARAARAWEHGGPAGLAVLEEDWTPDPEALARARAQLAAAWAEDDRPPALRATGNRWTAVGGDVQVRYGPDGRWWPYRKERGRWWPAGPSDEDPAAAMAALLTG
ncbi:SWF or SNF family helicase [Streptomyces sp. P1-3]|uniref:SWIM zinc finger family protein n=1 Tax=Streptomyces sp. P1-3 TaxID=3421658 RepID=UPI003D3684C3